PASSRGSSGAGGIGPPSSPKPRSSSSPTGTEKALVTNDRSTPATAREAGCARATYRLHFPVHLGGKRTSWPRSRTALRTVRSAPRRSVPRDQERAALAAVDACGGHSARCRGLYLRRDLLVAAAPAPSWANAAQRGCRNPDHRTLGAWAPTKARS